MSVEAAIVEWANERPAWQRALLRRLARAERLGPDEHARIADGLCAGQQVEAAPLAAPELRRGSVTTLPVTLRAVEKVVGVNALVGGQRLTFGEHGLTIVYGDNGCGKSGYARLIKNVVHARHRDQAILPNVFNTPPTVASAAIEFVVGTEKRQVAWPDAEDSDLLGVKFFDDACGDAYVSREAEATYRPVALHLLEALIHTLDGVRAVLDERARQLQRPDPSLPRVREGTPAATFLTGLTARTTTREIDAACALRPDIDDEIQRLRVEEARLLATDPTQERSRLSRLTADLSAIEAHIASCAARVNGDIQLQLEQLRDALSARRQAASAASERFSEEAVRGVGTEAWRALWNAARQFAATQTSDQRTPCAVDDRCVLCQQALPDDVKQRLVRFEDFVADEMQRQLRSAEVALERVLQSLRAVEVMPAALQTAIERIAATHGALGDRCAAVLDALLRRRDALIGQAQAQAVATEPVVRELRDAAAAVQGLAAQVPTDGFGAKIAGLRSDRESFEAQKVLSEGRVAIVREVERLRALARVEQAKTEASTNAASRKATELTRTHVTEVMRDRFTRETERLRLERVTLKDAGGQKGTLRHQPGLLGAMQKASLPQVLSEGEQTALGLAGFFTEVALDPSMSGIVLDDPVSSLDHIRRRNVAARLCEFAQERQVIVFTHDLAFVTDLLASADSHGVAVVERCVERRGTKEPGLCRDKHPWKAKDAAARLNELETDLARMRSVEAAWDQDAREREVADWAGRLSETWERLVNHEVAGQVLDRGTQEVRPSKFRIFARITDQDDNEFQASYATVSRWARRHDKSVALNYVAPALDEMQAELTRVSTWFRRVKKYRED